jgi:hypothetical protein
VPEIELPLQPLFDRFYDVGAFRKKIDYNLDPEPPLSDPDAVWADALLRSHGSRNAVL